MAMSRVKSLNRVLLEVPFNFKRFIVLKSYVFINRELNYTFKTS
jgi:hypothetical protein